jgi:hypothetical protein
MSNKRIGNIFIKTERGQKMKGKITEAVKLLTEIYNSIDRCNEKVTVPIMVALRNMEQVRDYLNKKGGDRNESDI